MPSPPKKRAKPSNKGGGRIYTPEERDVIVKYIVLNNKYKEVKGLALYQEIEDKNIINRTAYSMWEHFRKQIGPNIHTSRFNYLTNKQKLKFVKCCETMMTPSDFKRILSRVTEAVERDNEIGLDSEKENTEQDVENLIEECESPDENQAGTEKEKQNKKGKGNKDNRTAHKQTATNSERTKDSETQTINKKDNEKAHKQNETHPKRSKDSETQTRPEKDEKDKKDDENPTEQSETNPEIIEDPEPEIIELTDSDSDNNATQSNKNETASFRELVDDVYTFSQNLVDQDWLKKINKAGPSKSAKNYKELRVLSRKNRTSTSQSSKKRKISDFFKPDAEKERPPNIMMEKSTSTNLKSCLKRPTPQKRRYSIFESDSSTAESEIDLRTCMKWQNTQSHRNKKTNSERRTSKIFEYSDSNTSDSETDSRTHVQQKNTLSPQNKTPTEKTNKTNSERQSSRIFVHSDSSTTDSEIDLRKRIKRINNQHNLSKSPRNKTNEENRTSKCNETSKDKSKSHPKHLEQVINPFGSSKSKNSLESEKTLVKSPVNSPKNNRSGTEKEFINNLLQAKIPQPNEKIKVRNVSFINNHIADLIDKENDEDCTRTQQNNEETNQNSVIITIVSDEEISVDKESTKVVQDSAKVVQNSAKVLKKVKKSVKNKNPSESQVLLNNNDGHNLNCSLSHEKSNTVVKPLLSNQMSISSKFSPITLGKDKQIVFLTENDAFKFITKEIHENVPHDYSINLEDFLFLYFFKKMNDQINYGCSVFINNLLNKFETKTYNPQSAYNFTETHFVQKMSTISEFLLEQFNCDVLKDFKDCFGDVFKNQENDSESDSASSKDLAGDISDINEGIQIRNITNIENRGGSLPQVQNTNTQEDVPMDEVLDIRWEEINSPRFEIVSVMSLKENQEPPITISIKEEKSSEEENFTLRLGSNSPVAFSDDTVILEVLNDKNQVQDNQNITQKQTIHGIQNQSQHIQGSQNQLEHSPDPSRISQTQSEEFSNIFSSPNGSFEKQIDSNESLLRKCDSNLYDAKTKTPQRLTFEENQEMSQEIPKQNRIYFQHDGKIKSLEVNSRRTRKVYKNNRLANKSNNSNNETLNKSVETSEGTNMSDQFEICSISGSEDRISQQPEVAKITETSQNSVGTEIRSSRSSEIHQQFELIHSSNRSRNRPASSTPKKLNKTINKSIDANVKKNNSKLSEVSSMPLDEDKNIVHNSSLYLSMENTQKSPLTKKFSKSLDSKQKSPNFKMTNLTSVSGVNTRSRGNKKNKVIYYPPSRKTKKTTTQKEKDKKETQSESSELFKTPSSTSSNRNLRSSPKKIMSSGDDSPIFGTCQSTSFSQILLNPSSQELQTVPLEIDTNIFHSLSTMLKRNILNQMDQSNFDN